MFSKAIKLQPSENDHRRRAQLLHQILVSIGATDFRYDPKHRCFFVPDDNERKAAEEIYERTYITLEWKNMDALLDVLSLCGLLPSRDKRRVSLKQITPPYRKVG